MFAHKYFRRKVSEHPDFLTKVKNLYIPVTEEGDIFKAFALYLRPVTVGSGRTDKSEGEPFARHQAKIRPIGVPPDLQSGVKKGPYLLKICGFEIRSKQDCFSYWCWGITNPPILIGRIFLTADCKSAGTPNGSQSKRIHNLIEHPCNPCLTYSTLPFPAFRSARTCR